MKLNQIETILVAANVQNAQAVAAQILAVLTANLGQAGVETVLTQTGMAAPDVLRVAHAIHQQWQSTPLAPPTLTSPPGPPSTMTHQVVVTLKKPKGKKQAVVLQPPAPPTPTPLPAPVVTQTTTRRVPTWVTVLVTVTLVLLAVVLVVFFVRSGDGVEVKSAFLEYQHDTVLAQMRRDFEVESKFHAVGDALDKKADVSVTTALANAMGDGFRERDLRMDGQDGKIASLIRTGETLSDRVGNTERKLGGLTEDVAQAKASASNWRRNAAGLQERVSELERRASQPIVITAGR